MPAILQDNQTKQVLMLGYMNQEAFDKTMKMVWYVSIRGRNNAYGQR